MQAGGRRFDPVILHQFTHQGWQTSASEKSLLRFASLRLEKVGCCSLTIRRVESALLAESSEGTSAQANLARAKLSEAAEAKAEHRAANDI